VARQTSTEAGRPGVDTPRELLGERIDSQESVRLRGVGLEAGRVPAQLDHDAVRVEVVQRVAPAVVLFHRRFDALGGHAGPDRLLLLGAGAEGAVIHPEGKTDAVGHVRRPLRLFADLVELEERDALRIALIVRPDVVEDVTQPALTHRLDLGVNQREAHQILVEVGRRVDVPGGVGDMVQRHVAIVDPGAMRGPNAGVRSRPAPSAKIAHALRSGQRDRYRRSIRSSRPPPR
jgi:hypothetical protein